MASSCSITMTKEDASLAGSTLGSETECLGKEDKLLEEEECQTDLRRWRLHAENGRHTWKYLESDQDLSQDPKQKFQEIYWLGLKYEGQPEQKREHEKGKELSSNPSQAQQRQETLDALEKGSSFLRQLQMEDGSWGSNCDGPMFITAGIVFACYIAGLPIPLPLRQEMCRYLLTTRNDDGGWGVYLSGPSTVFGTAINYVMLRILGLGPEQPSCKKARDLLTSMGGVLGIPTWGRFWLCVLNLYDWDGIVPLPAELLLTPRGFPLNPANWWMPIRNIYMGMCYLYGHRFQAQEDDLIRAIRHEIYVQKSYGEITNWTAFRSYINTVDLLKPKSSAQSVMVSTMSFWERFVRFPVVNGLRARGLDEALFQVEADVHSTEYCSYAPAYWGVDIIVLQHAHGPDSHWVRGMAPHFADGLWMCREGLAASGTDGNAVWETSLSISAICSSTQLLTDNDLSPAALESLNAALGFLGDSQLLHNSIGIHRTYRHPTKGGWPYSTRMQGYIVSDVTAETLMAILQGYRVPGVSKQIPIERLQLAVDSLIGLECGGSGFGAYEHVRGWEMVELCNITDTYEDCMIERRYAETTGAVMMALTEFHAEQPDYRQDDIRRCISGGAAHLLRSQYAHGGWIGTWGVCFSFATMWALQGLACAGYTERNSSAVSRACAFLLRHQNPEDGGWGESLDSYRAKDYVAEPEGSQAPNTAYAIIGLLAARCTDRAAIDRGVGFLTKTQQPNGEWLPGTLEGIYTPPCGYRYPMYKFHFPLKALACYARRYGINALDSTPYVLSEKGLEK
ncbi:squalene-hopene-cyclase [Xylaria acuta]|nr:squalene-hopene-cyclase [Xylaria acuta]